MFFSEKGRGGANDYILMKDDSNKYLFFFGIMLTYLECNSQ